MKPTLTLIVGACLGIFLLTAPAGAQQAPALKTQKDMESYAVGVDMARNFKRQGIDLDLDVVLRGMKDVTAGNRLLLTEGDLMTTLNMFASELRRKKTEGRLIAQQGNKTKGEAFLSENKTKEGVVALPSGLQYKIVKAGSGKKPGEEDTVVCNYKGTLIDGTVFDSSGGSGQPATLKVSALIPGWREALKLMPAGSEWQLFIPSQLAYGQQGSGHIGPYETIIFDVELVDVK